MNVEGIYSSTIKTNILFNKDYDAQLFRQILHATLLEEVEYFERFYDLLNGTSYRMLLNYPMGSIP